MPVRGRDSLRDQGRAISRSFTTYAGLKKSLGRNVKLIKSYEEKGHLEKLVQYELAEYCVRLPNGRLSHEILNCDLATVFATIDRVIAEDLLGVSAASSSEM